jgi:FMN phosphatase YigB (HAD superfamily)
MKTIVWDVDDVLNEFMQKWLTELWLPEHPHSKLNYQILTKNPPHDILGVTKEAYLSSLDQFRLSGSFARLKPIPAVLEWFKQHGEKCRHVALTKVPVIAAPVSSEWVFRHFGKWIRSFHFVPSPRPDNPAPQYDENKGTYLHYFGKADLLIDDTIENIEAAEKVGVKTLIFPRPWNRSNLTIEELLNKTLKIIEG